MSKKGSYLNLAHYTRPSESVKMSKRKLSDFFLADRYEYFVSKGFVKNALKKDAFDFRGQNRP